MEKNPTKGCRFRLWKNCWKETNSAQKTGFPKKSFWGKSRPPKEKNRSSFPPSSRRSGEGEEGEIIGEAPLREEEGQGKGAGGQGDSENHELDESRAYDIGKALTEKFDLPNIQIKGKKSSLYKYSYELTDINRKFGQILEKKKSLKNILKTNLVLGTFDPENVSFDKIVVSPNDLVYRIVSREKEYESQAMVFFIRDYSGSMYGDSTEVVLSQHVLIYSWLLYQYQERVEKRFILHDTEAKEVENFVKYYRLNNGGGTNIASAYKLVNQIVEKENLAHDYNIYIFQGTDGDDGDAEGKEALPELEKILTYANRMGVTVVKGAHSSSNTYIERYLQNSKLLEKFPELFKLTTLNETQKSQDDLIKSIKYLVS
ncbi:DUF444 family protein [bacterium]|nr:DUF444 family protein [bacterium]